MLRVLPGLSAAGLHSVRRHRYVPNSGSNGVRTSSGSDLDRSLLPSGRWSVTLRGRVRAWMLAELPKMSVEVKPQPINGVSAGAETLLEATYPSIAATGLGRCLGSVMDLIPVSIGGVRLSHLLFGPVVAPVALLWYLLTKVTGDRYEVTNRSVRVRSILGGRLQRQVAFSDFAAIEVQRQPGQAFYHAGDLLLVDAKGQPVLTLAGVSRPERFRSVIQKARQARLLSDASLRTIEARARS